ncbi:hypothetical protein [Plebeiibacterium marinum]|uniref:Membrane dipeptidase n=1 Tax=Plebeiibacterium marinum TaxID=2992111 RepID=A0AAE3MEG4_9BACT|nr:hypothetical protein [Plebeiobacterium marinum]MCW3805951.1 hypothetical protein [Plebeiobacterium marinum]
MKKIFADLHCHPTMHPFAFKQAGKRKKSSLWSNNAPKKRQRDSPYPEYYQSNMPALARGNVKIVVASLYPLEQSWLDPEIIGTSIISDIIAKYFISHLPIKYINQVQSTGFDYYEFLEKEYEFLKAESGEVHKVDGENWKYVLARDKDEIDQYLLEENTIIVIPSIEGAHSLVSANADELIHKPQVHKSTLENIKKIKEGWEFPPLYITMSHHFYNGMLGHARSIPDGAGSFLLHQQVGMNEPMNPRGEEVIDCLLGINKHEGNGRRILIDTKHMSVAARLWYYDKIKKFNEGKGDAEKIPIIASHMGFGKHDTILGSVTLPDTDKEKYEDSDYFNPWSINLSKEEINIIVDSNGIIGLNMDQRILSGARRVQQSTRFSNSEIKNNDKEVVAFWTEQIGENILEIVRAVQNSDLIVPEGKIKVWDCVCLGTDFDGMINPVDSFIVADEFINLKESLKEYFDNSISDKSVFMGMTTEEVLDKMMFQNVADFVLKHYK